jgi:alpha-glucosidase (family GH31 glycosyl hydrolase)
VAAISRQYLGIRYSLLPYYYTLFNDVHNNGGMVWRPLVFEFPTDSNTVAIDRQLLVGGGLLITPVLTQGATSVVGYFPAGQWYDLLTYVPLPSPASGRSLSLQAPVSHLPIHVRGGTILPMQTPALTTPQTRQNPFSLLIAPDLNGHASGSLYWDDGVSLSMTPNSAFNFTASVTGSAGSLTITPVAPNGYAPPALTSFVVLGVQSAPSSANLNGASLSAAQFQYSSNSTSVTFTGVSVAWGSISLLWH